MATISIIEDEELFRENLIINIDKNVFYKVISDHGSVEDFLEQSLINPPEIILLDVGLPGISGIEGIPIILEKYSNANIIILTTYEEEEMIFSALSDGAAAYISKKTPVSKIVEAIDIVLKGGSYLSPTITKKVTKHFHKKPKQIENKLSERQLEIVGFISKGLTYAEIAEKCFISLNTVRFHIKNIYSSLGIKNKAALVNKYLSGDLN